MSLRVPARALVAGALLLLLAGCGCEKEKPASAAAGNGDGTVAADVLAAAANATYRTEHTGSGELRLADGHYEDPAEQVVSDLAPELSASGDLDGDGSADAVVVLVTGTGGSGVFFDLYALRGTAQGLRVSEGAFLGDRVQLEGVRVERGEVVVDLKVQGADDPLCCPTVAATYRFRLVGDLLRETTGTRAVYLKE